MNQRLTIGLVLLMAAPVAAEDWPTYRHDRLRTAVSGENLALPLEQIWSFRARQSRLAPRPDAPPQQADAPYCSEYTLPISAAGDALFFSSSADGRVVCLDAASGKMRWQFSAKAGCNRVPMFWDGKIYAGSDDGHAYCLDARTGKVVWQYQAAPAERWFLSYEQMISVWPVRTDLVVEDGIVYFAVGVFPHEGTFVCALDARTGKLLWRNGTQCEEGASNSLAPGGHIFLTQKQILIPKDFRGFSAFAYGAPLPFERGDGRYVGAFGSGGDPEQQGGLGQAFMPLLGAQKDGVRHVGTSAWKIEGEQKQRQELWKQDTPGRWTDIDSGLGVRVKRSPIFRYDPDLCSVICAGDVVFHTAFDTDPAKGVGSAVYARDPKDGKLLWSAEVPERANQVIAANGRLFLATRSGTIYCFAPRGAAKHGAIDEPVADAPFGKIDEEAGKTAETILKQTGVKDGYALVLDCTSGRLAYELAQRTQLYMCAVFRRAEDAAKARAEYGRANVHLTRIVTWSQAPDAKLPYPSFFADLVVSEAAAGGGPLPADLAEMERLQKPIRGVAFLGGAQSEDALKRWVEKTRQNDWRLLASGGHWAKRVRPRLPQGGAWTHMYGDPGNTACSHDAVLKPPLGVAWYGPPTVSHGSSQTALIVEGLLVVPEPNVLHVCDQYTGRELYTVTKPGIGAHRGTLAASRDSIFARLGDKIARIDLLTGKDLRVYEQSFGWFAVSDDGRKLFGAHKGLFAVDVDTGKLLWTWEGRADRPPIGALAMNDGKIYGLGAAADKDARQEAVAEMRAWLKTQPADLRDEYERQIEKRDVRSLVGVDAGTGEVLFQHGADITNCGGGNLRPIASGGRRGYVPALGLELYAHQGVILIGTAGGADKGWGTWYGGGYQARALTAHDGKTGKLLWNRFANYRTRPVIVGDTVHAEPWAFDLKTGAKKTRTHPVTGEQADWAWCRYDKQCGIFAASTHFLFGRSKGIGYHDLLTDQGLFTFWHSRSNCWVDTVSGGGMMIKPPQAIGCICPWSLPFTVALTQVPTQPAVPQVFAAPGPKLPVKHLHVAFGASGDRRDGAGNLWLATSRPVDHPLLLGSNVTLALYPGGDEVRRSGVFTPVENTDVPFVFASAVRGLKRCIVSVTTPSDGAGAYRVRLGFSALPGDKPGQRVFDVRLNGATVLKKFDVLAETQMPDRALWKEFTVKLDGDLVLDLASQADSPSAEEMPLICGLQIVRQEMTTLGLDVPQDIWLNRSAPKKTVPVALANLRSEEFRGRIVLEAPRGFELAVEDDKPLNLPPNTRATVAVRVAAQEGAAAGKHRAVLKLVADDGKTVLEHAFPVDWIGALERRVLRGQTACLAAEPLDRFWSKQIRPGRAAERLAVSQGARQANDGFSAASYVWFNVPDDIRDKVRHAHLRLHAAPVFHQFQTVAAPGFPEGALGRPASWGELKRVQGPPWPDFNKIKFPDLPTTLPQASRLEPSAYHPTLVEAVVPGSFDDLVKTQQVWLALEPASLNGAAYWSQHAQGQKVPVLVVDYEPK